MKYSKIYVNIFIRKQKTIQEREKITKFYLILDIPRNESFSLNYVVRSSFLETSIFKMLI